MNTNENKYLYLYIILIGAPLGMIGTLFLFNYLIPEWRWESVPMHASLEAFGGLAAILLCLFVFYRSRDDYSGELWIVSNGVLSMGTISIMHGLNSPGSAFVFLHSAAILAGGIWFALSWWPRNEAIEMFYGKRWLPWILAVLSVLLGIAAIGWPQWIPVMMIDGNFSPIANGMNVIAGLLFVISVPRFMNDFRRTGQTEFLYFFSFALLFGIVGLTFSFSKLWDFTWWLWHFLRLTAYVIGLWFLAKQYADTMVRQKQTEEALRQNQEDLERIVQKRTSELEQRSLELKTNQETLQTAIQEYLHFTQYVAQGNLTVHLDMHDHNGLGELSNNLNAMVDSLGDMTKQIGQATNNISSAATEILSATSQQASSASEQSSSIVQASTTVEQIKTIAQQTAQQSGQVAQDSQSMLLMAQRGIEAVDNTIHGMGQIRQRVESIAQTILSLSEQTQAIGSIITTVSEIADQSNMLALNAAIEAARAGEQGKSFAVVAQQVRELAERSKSATQQVQDILGEIQRATNNAVMVTEEGTKGVELGVQLSGEAGKFIRDIATEVENSARANSQMAAAAHQQMAGMEQISQAMKQIQQATTQSLSSMRQTEQAAKQLHDLSLRLQDAIETYNL